MRNAGPAPAGALRVEWFLAEERAGAGPLRLSRAAGQGTYSARPALAASTTAPAFSVILQLPAAPPSGWIGTRFVLLMKTDSANDVGESNEGNNFGQVGDGLDRWPLTITAPDLMGALCAGPTAANWGSAIAVRGRVRNAGTGASPSFQVQWFLSASTGGTNPVPLLRAGLTTGIYSHTSVAAGATGPEFAVNLQLPDRAPTGWSATTLYLFMGTDPANKVVESSETNNFARMGVGVDSCAFRLGSGADLQGALCTAPPSALWGSTIKVQGRVRNAGSLPAGQFRVQFYLSRDGLGSADDVLLSRSAGAGTYYLHPALAAQALGATFTVTLLLPTAAPAGWSAITSGTIIMRSDASALVPELYESNNFGQVGVGLDKAPITAGMLPDLQGCRLEVTPSALWGARVQVRAQVRNVGAAAGTFSVAFYLASSLDAKATRVLIKQPNGASLVSHAALAAGAAGPSFIVSLVLPATAPAGWPTAGGFLLMRTDSAGAVPESNENNNFGEVGLWKDRAFFVAGMQPDLAGATCSAPTIAFWGDTLAVNARVRNLSTGASDRFRIQWYLSQDTTGSADDLLLPLADGGGTYYSHPGLAAGAYGARFVVSVVLPAALPAGWTGDRFHVIMKSDAANQVAESNESNNFGQRGYGYDRSDLTITQARPDLSGRRCTSPAGSSAWGGTLPVTCQVRNGGSAPAGRFRVEWYLRGSGEPRLLSLADGMGSYYLHPALAAGATGLEFTVELQLPSTPLLDGYGNDFFVVMRCDPLNEVAESDEGNNFGEVGDDLDRTIVTVTAPMPDLRGALLDAPATAAWGSAMRVAARVANIGALASGRFRLQWYLSKDAVPTFDDVALPLVGGMGYLSHPGIAGGAEGANLAVDLQLPDAPPEGWTGTNCTLIMHVDSARQVEEVREDNNFGEAGAGLDSDVLAVTAVLPDLQGSRCLGPTAAAWGDALPVQVSVRNAGTAASGRFRLRWYLSRDAAGSADDLPLPLVDGMGDYYSHAGIAAGTNGTPVIVELQLPDALPAGWTGTAFTLIIKVDADAQVPESNEGNNFGQMGAGLDRAAITVR